MGQLHSFTKSTLLPASLEEVIDFHSGQDAIKKLVMPPLILQLVRDERDSLTSGEIEFNLWVGPLPIRWLARHEAGPTPHSFADRMISGPVAEWLHQHIFEDVPGGVRLTDQITFRYENSLKGFFSRLLFNPLSLRLLFAYRHWMTKRLILAIG